MKRCSKCGAENPDDKHWCLNCRKPLTNLVSTDVDQSEPAEKSINNESRLRGNMGNVTYTPTTSNEDSGSSLESSNSYQNENTGSKRNTKELEEQTERISSRLTGKMGSKQYERKPEPVPENSSVRPNKHQWSVFKTSHDSALAKKMCGIVSTFIHLQWRRIMTIVAILILITATVLQLFYPLIPSDSEKATDNHQETIQKKAEIIVPEHLAITESDIQYEDGYSFLSSQLLLEVRVGTEYESINQLVQSADGEIIGYISFSGDYQVNFPYGKTYDELLSIIDLWSAKPFVEKCTPNYVYKIDSSAVDFSNDAWQDTSSSENEVVNWCEQSPHGNNWWAEAIHMPSVWNMDIWDSLPSERVKIGIFDSVFCDAHNDLDSVFTKTWYNTNNSPEDYSDFNPHGTHVAGLIAAELGNGVGISGVASCVKPNLYGFADYGINSGTYSMDMEWKYAIALMLQEGVKIINMSMGYESMIFAAQIGNAVAKDHVEILRESISDFLQDAISAGYDFLIIKAAGNTSYYKWVSCEESKDYPYGYRKAQKGEKGFSRTCSTKYDFLACITEPTVRQRILIVGAVDCPELGSREYKAASYSNIGCDVYAPGTDVLSLSPGSTSTTLKTGTSMATPIVAGIAGLVWTVNPDLPAASVKEIITSTVSPFESNSGGVAIVNAAAAVNLALKSSVSESKSTDNYSILLGTVYEGEENNNKVDVFGIPNAKISITATETGEPVETVTSTDLGSFTAFLVPDYYTVTVSIPGYYQKIVSFELVEGESLYLSICMEPDTTEKISNITTEPTSNYTNLDQVLVKFMLTEYVESTNPEMSIHVSAATLNIRNEADNSICKTINLTNEAGIFDALLEPGIYIVNGEVDGYSVHESIVEVTSDMPAYVTILVSPDEVFAKNTSPTEAASKDETSPINLYSVEISNQDLVGEWVIDEEFTSAYYNMSMQEICGSDYCSGNKITFSADGTCNYSIAGYSGNGSYMLVFSMIVVHLSDVDIPVSLDYLSVLSDGTTTYISSDPFRTGNNVFWVKNKSSDETASSNGTESISETQDAYAAYVSVVEQAITSNSSNYTTLDFLEENGYAYGILADLDNDRTEELLLNYCASGENDIPFTVYSVYDYENGNLKTVVDQKEIVAHVGASYGYAGIVNYRGTPTILVCSEDSDGTGPGTTHWYDDTLYSYPSVNPIRLLEHTLYWAEWSDDSYAYYIDGEEVPLSEFEKELADCEYLELTESGGTTYTYDAMTLTELLEYLQSNA